MDQTKKTGTGALSLAALGVVYGDIGTSPLYAFKEAFTGAHALAPTEPNVLATLSAMFWAMMLIISVKYVWVMLKFDNDGEGGVLALTALANRTTKGSAHWKMLIVAAGIFAAALFYGDALITPAISVLSAVEGLSVATPAFETYIIPITVGVLTGLFFIQRHGTGSMGKLFGPVTLLWFAALAILGAISIAQNPLVLNAINPMYAINFALEHPAGMFMLLSAVFLALTGGEALYADMGHFGRQAGAAGLVWPGLPGAAHQLFRPGRTGAALGGCHPESVLSAVAGLVHVAAGRTGHRGNRDRVAGHHLRRLFDDAAGHAHGLSAAPVHPAHLRFATRPDLHPRRELDDAGRGHRAGARIRFLRARWPRLMASPSPAP